MFLEGGFNPVKDIKYVMFFRTERREVHQRSRKKNVALSPPWTETGRQAKGSILRYQRVKDVCYKLNSRWALRIIRWKRKVEFEDGISVIPYHDRR